VDSFKETTKQIDNLCEKALTLVDETIEKLDHIECKHSFYRLYYPFLGWYSPSVPKDKTDERFTFKDFKVGYLYGVLTSLIERWSDKLCVERVWKKDMVESSLWFAYAHVPITRAQLSYASGLSTDEIDRALKRLTAEKMVKVERRANEDGLTTGLVIRVTDPKVTKLNFVPIPKPEKGLEKSLPSSRNLYLQSWIVFGELCQLALFSFITDAPLYRHTAYVHLENLRSLTYHRLKNTLLYLKDKGFIYNTVITEPYTSLNWNQVIKCAEGILIVNLKRFVSRVRAILEDELAYYHKSRMRVAKCVSIFYRFLRRFKNALESDLQEEVWRKSKVVRWVCECESRMGDVLDTLTAHFHRYWDMVDEGVNRHVKFMEKLKKHAGKNFRKQRIYGAAIVFEGDYNRTSTLSDTKVSDKVERCPVKDTGHLLLNLHSHPSNKHLCDGRNVCDGSARCLFGGERLCRLRDEGVRCLSPSRYGEPSRYHGDPLYNGEVTKRCLCGERLQGVGGGWEFGAPPAHPAPVESLEERIRNRGKSLFSSGDGNAKAKVSQREKKKINGDLRRVMERRVEESLRRQYPRKVFELVEYWNSLGLRKSRVTSKSYRSNLVALQWALNGKHPGLKGRKFTVEQIKHAMSLFAKKALDPNYTPVNEELKKKLRRMSIAGFVYSWVTQSSILADLVDGRCKVEKVPVTDEVPEDLVAQIKQEWKDRVNEGRWDKFTPVQEEHFTLAAIKLEKVFKEVNRRIPREGRIFRDEWADWLFCALEKFYYRSRDDMRKRIRSNVLLRNEIYTDVLVRYLIWEGRFCKDEYEAINWMIAETLKRMSQGKG